MHQPKRIHLFRPLLVSVFLALSMLVPLSSSAQYVSPYFNLTGAVQRCGDSVLDLSWTAIRTVQSVTISISNTSSNWHDQLTLTNPTATSYVYDFNHHAIDKVVVQATLEDDYVPANFTYSVDVGNCGVQSVISGGRVGDEQPGNGIEIAINNLTCSGFDWSVRAPQDVQVYVAVMDIIGQGMIPFVPVTGTDVSRTETFTVTTENQTWFSVSVKVYDPVSNEELASEGMSKQCPIAVDPPVTPTATATVTPTTTATVTPTSTSAPVESQTAVLQIVMPGGASIEGAPYQVFTDTASQAAAVPYKQGTVGANNTITLTDILPGNYSLIVKPVGFDTISVAFTVGTAEVTSLKIVVDEDGTVTVVPADPDPVATVSETAAGTTADAVSGLPETGTGDGQSHASTLFFGMSAVLLIGASLAIARRLRIH